MVRNYWQRKTAMPIIKINALKGHLHNNSDTVSFMTNVYPFTYVNICKRS